MWILRRILISILALYVIACAVLYVAQDQIIFNPDKLPEDYRFRAGEEVEIEVAPNIYLNNVYVREPSSKGVILYLHGNRGSNRRCLRQAEMFMGMGYDLFMPDYRGYGKSDGNIESEKQLLSDVQQVYDYLSARYDESQITIVGYSLGTGMASYLAAHNDPARLCLIAPYTSFIDLKNQWTRLIPDFLVKYPLNNEKYLAKVSCPVQLFHGTEDEVIPYQSSEVLSQLSPAIQLTTLDQTGHRRAIFHQTVRSTIRRIIG